MGIYQFAKKFSNFLKSVFRLDIKGLENVPESGPVILCSNHRSNYDPIILSVAVGRQLLYMAKAELFRVPLLKQLITALGAFPVRRGTGDRAAIRHAENILREGKILAMFPEGTRLKKGGVMLPFKTGAVRLAIKTGAPILPVAIVCAGRVRPFRRTALRFGKPIPAAEFGTGRNIAQMRKSSERIRQAVAALAEDAEVPGAQ